MILLTVKLLLFRSVKFLFLVADWFIIFPMGFFRRGCLVTKCTMYLLYFAKIQLLYLLVRKKLIISNKYRYFCYRSIVRIVWDLCSFQIESEQTNKENAPRNFNFLVRKDNDEKNFADIIEQIKQSHEGKTLGVFAKDKIEGAFGEQWQNCLGQQSFTNVNHHISFQKRNFFINDRFQVDISASIAYLLAIKDDEELGLIRKACEITGKLYSKHLKDQIINTVDSERVSSKEKLFEIQFVLLI